MSKIYLRAYSALSQQVREAEPGSPIRFTASTQGIKRDGMDLQASDWHLENFKRNPVFLWVHDYHGSRPPIGKVADVGIDKEAMQVDVVFDQQDEFARTIESKYRRGFLNAVSVGWGDMRVGEEVKYDLLDVSGVPVPGDPDALMERQYRALQQVFEEQAPTGGAVPPHSTALAAEDAVLHTINLTEEVDGLRSLFAWSEQGAGVKMTYKLQHHQQNGEAVWRGVAESMARLFTPAAQIPSADREAVYKHLQRHYQQFGKVPPDFKTSDELGALTPELVRGLFYEDEPALVPWLFTARTLTRQEHKALQDAIAILKDISETLVPHDGSEPEPEPEPEPGDEPTEEQVAALEQISEKLSEFGVVENVQDN